MLARWLPLVATLASGVAAAAPHELRWERDPGAEHCIASAELVTAVEHRRGRPLGDGTGAARTIEGRVAPMPGGFQVVLVVRDSRGNVIGERTLAEPGDCRKLDEPLVLVLSLIVDAEAIEAPPPPSPPPIARPPQRAARTPWRTTLAVSGLGAVGALPGIALGGDGVLEVDVPALPAASISIGGWLPAQHTVAAGGSRFTAFGAGVRVCPVLARPGAGELRACGGADGMRVAARGMDFAINHAVVEWIAYARAEVEVVYPITGRTGFVAGAGAWVALIRPRFVYSDGTQVLEIYDTPPVAGVLRLGVRVSL